MASDVTMPRLSDSMEEGTVLKWLVDEGAEVKRGEPLVEIETDKANMTYDADTDGTLIEIVAQEGDTLEIGEVIARIGDASEAKGDGGGEESGGEEADADSGGDEEESGSEESGDEDEGAEEGEEAAAAESDGDEAQAAEGEESKGDEEEGGQARARRPRATTPTRPSQATRPPRRRARRPPLPAPMAAVARRRPVPGPPLVRRLRPGTVTGV